jgi:hypothetical protein
MGSRFRLQAFERNACRVSAKPAKPTALGVCDDDTNVIPDVYLEWEWQCVSVRDPVDCHAGDNQLSVYGNAKLASEAEFPTNILTQKSVDDAHAFLGAAAKP